MRLFYLLCDVHEVEAYCDIVILSSSCMLFMLVVFGGSCLYLFLEILCLFWKFNLSVSVGFVFMWFLDCKVSCFHFTCFQSL